MNMPNIISKLLSKPTLEKKHDIMLATTWTFLDNLFIWGLLEWRP